MLIYLILIISINCQNSELSELKLLKQQLEAQLRQAQQNSNFDYAPTSFLQQNVNTGEGDNKPEQMSELEKQKQQLQELEKLQQQEKQLEQLQNSQEPSQPQNQNLQLPQKKIKKELPQLPQKEMPQTDLSLPAQQLNQQNDQSINQALIDKINNSGQVKNKYLQEFKQKALKVPQCTKKEGQMKVREWDQKSKDVPISYAILTNDRLSYFIDQKDESTIQGSVLLKNIVTPIQCVENFSSCFEIKTQSNFESYVICVENENTARNWILSITQNVINCN